jgi:hypothetical protein
MAVVWSLLVSLLLLEMAAAFEAEAEAEEAEAEAGTEAEEKARMCNLSLQTRCQRMHLLLNVRAMQPLLRCTLSGCRNCYSSELKGLLATRNAPSSTESWLI